MPKTSITFTDDLHAAVEAYRQQQGYSKFTQAAVALMRIGLEAETGEPAPEPPTMGGWRGNEKSLENLLHYVDELTDKGANDPTE